MRRSVLWFALALCLFAASVSAQERLLLLPLSARGMPPETTEALWDLLSTRILAEGLGVVEKAEVQRVLEGLGPEEIDEEMARWMGRRLGVRWVVLGQVVKVGEAISVDLKVLDSTGTSPPKAVYGQYSSEEALLSGLQGLAKELKERIVGREVTFRGQGTLRAQLLYQALGYSRIQRFPGRVLKGVSIGDLDGDGQREMVLIEPHRLLAYRDTGEGLKMLAELERPSTYNFLNVGTVDLNGDGRAEVAVTAVLGDDLRSFVVGLKGKEFKVLKEGINRYLRVARVGGRRVLLAQAMGPDTDYVGSIEELWLDGKKLRAKELKGLPPEVGWLYSFALGYFTGGEYPEVARINPLGELEVLTLEGQRLWKGGKDYGASDNYFDRPKVMADEKGMPSTAPRRVYLPVRMASADLDQDGYDELLVAKNRFSLGQVLEKVRVYGSGEIVALVWDGMAMAEAWRTQEMPGCVFDFELGDLDNDGMAELVAVVVNEPLLKKGSSNLVVFELYE